MTRRTRRLAAAREREGAQRRRMERDQGTFRYYVHIRAEWGMGRPYNLIRVRGDGLEEVVEPGSGWRPMENALHRAHHWSPGEDRVVEVGADEAAKIAKLWAYTYQRIVEASTGRTVAFTKSYIVPSVPMLAPEQSVCRSGIWEHTRRLSRIGAKKDFYDVRTVTVATVDEYLRDRPRPDFRFFAVVVEGGREFALNDPGDVLRVRTGDEDGARERLGPDGWEPYDMIDGTEGLRGLTLLEIDDEAVEAFRHRPAEDRAYYAGSETAESASIVFRRRQTAIGVREELLTWGARWTSRVPPNSLDQDLSMAEISPEQLDRLAAELRYAYYEILPERGGGPVALVRKAPGRPEEAAVGWPVWFRSEWLNQIAKGMIPYRARPVDEDTGERFVRRIARERSEYRYFMFLDDDQAIDAGRILVRATCGANGEPNQAEIQRADGTWDATDIFHRWRWNHEDRNPVEIPPEMAAASRR
jgi:hypothetical protein